MCEREKDYMGLPKTDRLEPTYFRQTGTLAEG